MKALMLLLAILPGLLICFLIYRADKYERESLAPLIFCFFIGAALPFPVINLEKWLNETGLENHNILWLSFFSSFLFVALPEEIIKFFALLIYPFRRSFFNEPLDGIIYAVFISMGFATSENVLYAFQFGIETIILRAFTAVPAHGVFAVWMGYFIGLAKFTPEKKWLLFLKGLGLAVFIHGFYNFFILQEAYEWLIGFAIATLGLSFLLALDLITHHQENSPFK